MRAASRDSSCGAGPAAPGGRAAGRARRRPRRRPLVLHLPGPARGRGGCPLPADGGCDRPRRPADLHGLGRRRPAARRALRAAARPRGGGRASARADSRCERRRDDPHPGPRGNRPHPGRHRAPLEDRRRRARPGRDGQLSRRRGLRGAARRRRRRRARRRPDRPVHGRGTRRRAGHAPVRTRARHLDRGRARGRPAPRAGRERRRGRGRDRRARDRPQPRPDSARPRDARREGGRHRPRRHRPQHRHLRRGQRGEHPRRLRLLGARGREPTAVRSISRNRNHGLPAGDPRARVPADPPGAGVAVARAEDLGAARRPPRPDRQVRLRVREVRVDLHRGRRLRAPLGLAVRRRLRAPDLRARARALRRGAPARIQRRVAGLHPVPRRLRRDPRRADEPVAELLDLVRRPVLG